MGDIISIETRQEALQRAFELEGVGTKLLLANGRLRAERNELRRRQRAFEGAGGLYESQLVKIIFDGPPSPKGPVFVEVEDAYGNSVKAGEWEEREDGYWTLGDFMVMKPLPGCWGDCGSVGNMAERGCDDCDMREGPAPSFTVETKLTPEQYGRLKKQVDEMMAKAGPQPFVFLRDEAFEPRAEARELKASLLEAAEHIKAHNGEYHHVTPSDVLDRFRKLAMGALGTPNPSDDGETGS